MSTETGAAAPVEATAVEATEQSTAATEAQAEARRMFKLKVNGKEEDVPEDVVVREAQIARAMRAKAQKLGMTVKQYESFQARLDSDDDYESALAERLGPDRLHKLAVDHLSKKLRHEMLSPEQREMLAIREENNRLKAEHQAREQKAKQEQTSAFQRMFAAKLDVEVPAAFKASGLPTTPAVVDRFTALMAENIQNDIDLTPAEVAKFLRQELQGEFKSFLKGMGDEDLDGLLDEDLLERRRKSAIAKAKAAQKAGRPVGNGQRAAAAERKEITTDDFRAYAERLRNGEE